MANDIEQKVVEMRFDNAQFEAGVSQSLSTIERLKQSLNFKNLGDGFKSLFSRKPVSGLESIERSLQTVTNRFSTFGIVGARVIQKLTDTAMNFGHKLTNAITEPLVHGGIQRAMDIAQAKFMVEGLGQAWDDVSESVSEAVQDTAYGFDEAAKAAAQLGASGIKAGDDLTKHLLAIGGTAAMTGASFTDISDVFTSIAGQGKLMAYQLNQLSFRGLNAAAVLAEQLGKTEAEVRDMVHKGEIDFDTFSKAMYSAFGDHAKDANKTFTGALANMKAALKRIGQDVALPALDSFRDVFNALKGAINKVHVELGNSNTGFLGDLVKGISFASKQLVKFINKLDFGWVKGAANTIENIFLGLVGIFLRTKDALSGTIGGGLGKSILEIGKSIHSWSEGFRDSHFGTYMDEVKAKAEAAKKPLYDVGKLAKEVISGNYGNGQKRVDELHKIGASYAKVQNRVNELLGCEVRHKETAEDLAAEEKRRGKIQEQLVKSTTKQINKTKKASTVYEKLANIIAGAISAVKMVASAASAFYKILLKPAVITFLKTALNIGSAIGAKLVELQKYTSKNDTFTKAFTSFKKVLLTIPKAIIKIEHGIGTIVFKIRSIVSTIKNFKPLQAVFKGISSAVKSISKSLKGSPEKLKNVSDIIWDLLKKSKGFQHLADSFNRLKQSVTGGLINAFERLSGATTKVGEGISSWLTIENITTVFDFLLDKIATLIDLFLKGGEAAQVFFSFASDKVGNPFENIGKAISSIKNDLTGIKAASGEASKSFNAIFDGFAAGSKTVYENSKKAGENLFKGLADGFKGINIERALGWAKTSAQIYAIFKMVDFLKRLGSGIDSVKAIPKKLTGVFDALSAAINEHANKIKADTIWTLAKSIFVISAAILMLSGIETDKLAGIAVDIAAVIGAIALLTLAMSKLPEKQRASEAEKAFKTVGLGIKRSLMVFAKNVSEGLRDSLKLFGVSSVITSFAIGVSILVKTFMELATYLKDSKGDIEGAGKIMGIIAGAILGFIVLISTAPSQGATAGAAAAVLGIAFAIKSLVNTMKLLGKMPVDEFEKGAGALVAISLALGILTGFSSKVGNFDGLASSILKVAAAMTLMVIPLKLLSKENPMQLLGIAVSLGALGAMAASIASFSEGLGEGAKNLVVLSGAMLLLAASLRIIAPVSDKVIDCITSLVVIMGALTIGAVAASALGEGFMTFAAALVATAASFLMFGAGALMFGKGVEAIGTGLSLIGQGVQDLTNGIITSLETVTAKKEAIANGIKDLLGSVAKGIAASKTDIIQGTAAFVTGFANGITQAIPAICTAARAVILAVMTTIVGMVGLIVDLVCIGVVTIINEVARVIAENSQPIMNAAMNLIRSVLIFAATALEQLISSGPFGANNPISKWLRGQIDILKGQMNYENGYEIGNTFSKGQADGYKDGAVNIIPEAKKPVEEAKKAADEKAKELAQGKIPGFIQDPLRTEFDAASNAATDGAQMIMNAIQNGMDPQQALDLANSYGININSGLISAIKSGDYAAVMEWYADSGNNAFASEAGINSPSTVFMGYGENIIEGLAIGLSRGHDTVLAPLKSLASSLGNVFKGKSFGGAGASLMSGLISSLKSGASMAKSLLNTSVTQWKTAITSKIGLFRTAGTQIMNGLVTGLKEKAGAVKTAFTTALTRARSAAADFKSRFRSVGSSLIEGLKSGIESKAGEIARKAASIVSRAIQAAKDKAKINSPSKEFMWIGEGFGEGLIKGIGNFAKNVSKSSGDMVTKAIGSAQGTLSGMADLLSVEAGSPVITPVVDASNIYATADDINRLFNTQSLGLNSQVSAVMNKMNQPHNETTNSDIVNQLKKLGRDLVDIPRNQYNVNGITYDDGSNISSAIDTLIRAAIVEGRA